MICTAQAAADRGLSWRHKAPQKFIDTAVISAGQKAGGAIPEYNVTNVGTYIPTINLSGEQIYAGSAPAVDPFEYTRSVESGMGYVGNMGRQYDVYKSYMGTA